MKLPQDYIVSMFYQYAGYVKHKFSSHIYHGGCPTCHEGKSWKKKSRLNYIPNKDMIHCFNCNRTWSPTNWIMEQSGKKFFEIIEEAKEYNFDISELESNDPLKENINPNILPQDSINLFNSEQTNYYRNNKVVVDALKYLNSRRLTTAINKPKAFYISLTDYIHKNRLVIPFYDIHNKIIWYQTRALYKKDEVDRPKYLSKMDSEKSVYNIDNINPQLDYIFIFEGPIDSMFVQNGVAMAGLNLSETQTKQMQRYPLHQKIWVLDNEFDTNENVKDSMNRLLERGERVFIWPKKYKGIKDINSLCVKVNKDSISPDFFIKNSYEGSEGLCKLVTF